jgi:hypothetical protein
MVDASRFWILIIAHKKEVAESLPSKWARRSQKYCQSNMAPSMSRWRWREEEPFDKHEAEATDE